MFDFRRITLFCLGYRLSNHEMTMCSKNVVGHSTTDRLATPMYGGKYIFDFKLKKHVLGYFKISVNRFSFPEQHYHFQTYYLIPFW